MSHCFNEGDVLIYFNQSSSHIVLLDKIDEDYFTIVTTQNEKYEYGFKILIRNLTAKNFIKLDKKFLRQPGDWERYEIDHNLFHISQDLKFI